MVTVWSDNNHGILSVSQALEPHTDFGIVRNRLELRERLPESDCIVVDLHGRGTAEQAQLLAQVQAERRVGGPATTWAIAVLHDPGAAEEIPELRRFPCSTVSRADDPEWLWDAVLQDAARAALASTRASIASALPSELGITRALRILTQSRLSPTRVADMADRAQCSTALLRRQWRAVSGDEGPGLKDFLDIHLLLKARATKTPRLRWVDVAGELHTELGHLRDVAARSTTGWRALAAGGWLQLSARLRHDAGKLGPPRHYHV